MFEDAESELTTKPQFGCTETFQNSLDLQNTYQNVNKNSENQTVKQFRDTNNQNILEENLSEESKMSKHEDCFDNDSSQMEKGLFF